MSFRLCIVSGYPITVPPCRSLCIAVRDACLPTMASFGYSWPHILNCSVFPSAAKKLCIPGEKLISATGELDLLFGHQVKRKQNKNETAIDLDIKFMYRLIMVESIILSSITDIEIGIKKQGLCLKSIMGMLSFIFFRAPAVPSLRTELGVVVRIAETVLWIRLR